jgi:hypothetical protein
MGTRKYEVCIRRYGPHLVTLSQGAVNILTEGENKEGWIAIVVDPKTGLTSLKPLRIPANTVSVMRLRKRDRNAGGICRLAVGDTFKDYALGAKLRSVWNDLRKRLDIFKDIDHEGHQEDAKDEEGASSSSHAAENGVGSASKKSPPSTSEGTAA